MSADRNKAMVRRLFEEAMNQNRLDIIDDVVAPDYVNHDMPMTTPGRDGLRQVWEMFHSAFPDIRITLDDVFADGDLVGTRGHWTGTHRGDFMGVPATGKHVEVKYQDLWRVDDGKLRENWVQMDLLGLMQQLGVVPTGAESGRGTRE